MNVYLTGFELDLAVTKALFPELLYVPRFTDDANRVFTQLYPKLNEMGWYVEFFDSGPGHDNRRWYVTLSKGCNQDSCNCNRAERGWGATLQEALCRAALKVSPL